MLGFSSHHSHIKFRLCCRFCCQSGRCPPLCRGSESSSSIVSRERLRSGVWSSSVSSSGSCPIPALEYACEKSSISRPCGSSRSVDWSSSTTGVRTPFDCDIPAGMYPRLYRSGCEKPRGAAPRFAGPGAESVAPSGP